MNGIGTPEVTHVITTAHLILIALLAIAAMLVIWWGGYRRRQRRLAELEAERHRDRAEREPEPTIAAPRTAAEPAPRAAPVAPPVAPAPPPIEDVPVTAPAATTAPQPAAPAPSAAGAAMLVTRLKGLGPKVAARLDELGISTVDQLAVLSPAEAEALDAELGAFKGRMARDRWIEQAKLLAAGDTAGFEATFGKLG